MYKKYQDLVDSDKSILKNTKYDGDFRSRVLLGLGIFFLGISALPKSLTAIIRIVGFAGNKEKGQQYLMMCMEEGYCRSPYAALILSLYQVDMEPKLQDVC